MKLLVLALIGCGQASRGATAPSGPQMEDGRLVEILPAPRWCYGHAETNAEGGCFEDKLACDDHLVGQRRWTFGERWSRASAADRADPDRARAINRAIFDEWTDCALASTMSCLRMRQVLAGSEVELCYLTIAKCEGVIRANRVRPDPDYVVTTERCSIARAR